MKKSATKGGSGEPQLSIDNQFIAKLKTLALWLSVGPLIGAGIGAPFNHLQMGALLGLAVWLFAWSLVLYLGVP